MCKQQAAEITKPLLHWGGVGGVGGVVAMEEGELSSLFSDVGVTHFSVCFQISLSARRNSTSLDLALGCPFGEVSLAFSPLWMGRAREQKPVLRPTPSHKGRALNSGPFQGEVIPDWIYLEVEKPLHPCRVSVNSPRGLSQALSGLSLGVTVPLDVVFMSEGCCENCHQRDGCGQQGSCQGQHVPEPHSGVHGAASGVLFSQKWGHPISASILNLGALSALT